jgi:hypothetical protein
MQFDVPPEFYFKYQQTPDFGGFSPANYTPSASGCKIGYGRVLPINSIHRPEDSYTFILYPVFLQIKQI